MILTFWKYLEGYVVLQVSGFAPERFINLCANQNIYIWNIQKTSDAYVFCVSKKAFFMLRPIAKKTKCRVKIIRKIGLPFKTKKIKKNRFFFAGLILALFIILSLSFFVWKIDVQGNTLVTAEEIIEALQEKNVFVGVFKPKINCAELDDFLLLRFNQTMWVSSELKGTKLTIYVREGIEVENFEKDLRPCDLLATESGIIVSIITRKGTPLVKAGDVVEKGTLLVSGTLEIMELTVLKAVDFTASDADIMIQSVQPYKDLVYFKYVDKQFSVESKKDYYFQILGTEVNIFRPRIEVENCDKIYTSKQVELIKNFFLPIFIKQTVYLPFVEVEKKYTQEQAIEILQNRFLLYIEKLKENNIQILSNDVVFMGGEDYLNATGTITIAKKDGEKVFFNQEERRKKYDEYFTEKDGNSP